MRELPDLFSEFEYHKVIVNQKDFRIVCEFLFQYRMLISHKVANEPLNSKTERTSQSSSQLGTKEFYCDYCDGVDSCTASCDQLSIVSS